MKSTSKFLAVMLAITGLFCCAVAVGIGAGFNAVRASTDKKIIAVAEKVREQYPDISEKELAQILNSETAGIKGDFAKYGIKSDSGWVDIQSGSYATITIVIATAGVCVFGILLCVVFIRYCKKQKRQRLEIVKCLEKINNREYDLDLDECISRTEVLADIRDVRIEKTVKNDFNLNCDFRWICEAVSNIVKNCIEHTDGGYVRISAERNSMYSEIIISDNGCGISPKDLPHIFERFYKAQNSSPSSVGIGLSLAKSIVEKTGGYITADSKLGVGSTFKLRFLNVRLR